MKQQQKQQQEQTPFRLPSGRRPAFAETEDHQQRSLLHHSQLQPDEHEEQRHAEEQCEGQEQGEAAHGGHPRTSPRQRSTEEQGRERGKNAASGRSDIPAASLLRALWPGSRDVSAAQESMKPEGNDKTSGRSGNEEGRFRASDASSNTSGAVSLPHGADAAERAHAAAAGRPGFPPLPTCPAEGTAASSPSCSSSFASSSSFPPPFWSAAGLSAASHLPFFAAWLPPSSAAAASSDTRPQAAASVTDVYRHRRSSADSEAVKKCVAPLPTSEAATWFSSKASGSSRSCDGNGSLAEAECALSASQEAVGARKGACSSVGAHAAYSGASGRDARLRRKVRGSQSPAPGTCPRGAGISTEAQMQEGAANENNAVAGAPAPRSLESESSAGAGGIDGAAGPPQGGAPAAADRSAAVRCDEGNPRRTDTAPARVCAVEANGRREQHAKAPRHQEKTTTEGDNVHIAATRDPQRNTRLLRSKCGHSGRGRSSQLFLDGRGTLSRGESSTQSEQQQRQRRNGGREATAAGSQACTHGTLRIKKNGKRESSTGELMEDTASASSSGWMDQLRRVLRQTSLLGGSSTAPAKQSPSPSSSVCPSVASLDDAGTEDELSDTELLLLQGVSICKLPEECLEQAAHGSEPCNVLVCVEPVATPAASSARSVVAAGAVCDAAGDIAAARVAGGAAAPLSPSRRRSTSSTRTSRETFSALWEGSSFFPPSLASLAAAVNLRPWLGSEAALPSTPTPSATTYIRALCSSSGSKSNSGNYSYANIGSNNNRSSSSSDRSLILTEREPPERRTYNSCGRSSRLSQPECPALRERNMETGEDFASLFARCRSSVSTEADSAGATPAVPLHALAVLRAHGTSKTYLRVPAQQQQQQQEEPHEEERKQRPEQWQRQPQQAATSGGVAEQNAREEDARGWVFIPLQQPSHEQIEQPQQAEVQEQEADATQTGDHRGQRQRHVGSAEITAAGAVTERQQSDGRQEQLQDVAEGSRAGSSSTTSTYSSSGDTVKVVSPQDAWSEAEPAGGSVAAVPSESSCTKSTYGRSDDERSRTGNSGGADSCVCHRRSSLQVTGGLLGDVGGSARKRGKPGIQSLYRQEKLELQQEGPTSTAARPEDAEEHKDTDFLSSDKGSTGTARGARSWAQCQYATRQHRSSKGMHMQRQGFSTADGAAAQPDQGSAVDHSRGRRRWDSRSTVTSQGVAGVLPTQSPAAATEAAGALDAEARPSIEKSTKQPSGQQQTMGWWAEISKGVTDFFSQQQGVLLPDVYMRHCETPDPPAASGRIADKKQQHQEEIPPSLSPLRAPLGFSFSPAGLLGPYHLGVVSLLCEANVINEYTPVAGASAGSLAAVAVGLNLSAATVMSSIKRVNEDLKEKGTAQRLGKRLRKELTELIPEDCAAVLGKRPGKITVTYTHVFPYIHGAFVSSFFGKSDLIDCLMASCNIPFYFTKWPTITCRGRQCVDGFFATKHKTFGCPDTGALRDVKVVPFYASTVGVTSAAEDCINPDLQAHDQQILHYLRAKALLRARARLLREQMQQQRQDRQQGQRQEQQGAHPQPAGGKQRLPLQEHQQHAQQHRLASYGLGSTGAGSPVVSGCLTLLPSVCPLHGVGRDGKNRPPMAPRDTDTNKTIQFNAEDKASSCSNACPAALTKPISAHSQRSSCGSSSCPQTEGAEAATARSDTLKQQHESRGPDVSATAAGIPKTTTFSGGSAPLPYPSLLRAPASTCTLAADATESIPRGATSPFLPCSDAASVWQDPPSVQARASAFSTEASLLPLRELSTTASLLPSTAAAAAPGCGTTSPAAAATLPAAAAATTEAAAQRGEEVCAFESIYACPVCSPLGEVCPPQQFSYYYHDPLSASFGCGAITSSATCGVGHVAAASAAAPPPLSYRAGGRPSAAACRRTDVAASTALEEPPATAPPVADVSAVPAEGGEVVSSEPDTATSGRISSSSSLPPGAPPGGAAACASQMEEFAKGEGPAGPVASLTTLGTASGLLRTAAEETLELESSSKVNHVKGKYGGDSIYESNSRDNSTQNITDIPILLSAALSSVVPGATDAARQFWAAADVATLSAPAAGRKSGASAAAVDVPTSTHAVGAPSGAVSLPPAKAAPVPEAAGLPSPAVAGAKRPAAVPASQEGSPPTAAASSTTRKVVSSSTSARQRRRLRACKQRGELCTRERCGCAALPPLLRLSCSTQELLQIALEASPNETLLELFDLGRADAFRWLVLEYMRCEDDLIHRRAAAGKTAHPQQQQHAELPARENTCTTRAATTGSGGKAVYSEVNTTRRAGNYGFFMPALRQRWKSVSGRWGRSRDSSSTAANTGHSSRSSQSFTSTPEAGEGPALRPAKGEDCRVPLTEADAPPATAAPRALVMSAGQHCAAKDAGRCAGTAAAAHGADARCTEGEAQASFLSSSGTKHVALTPPISEQHKSEQQSTAFAQPQQGCMTNQAPRASSGSCKLPAWPTHKHQKDRLVDGLSTRRLRTSSAAKLPESCATDGAGVPAAAQAGASSEKTRAAFADAVEDADPALATANCRKEQTAKPSAATAAGSKLSELQEGAPELEHAATAPANFLASSDFRDVAAMSTDPYGAVFWEHPVAKQATPAPVGITAPAAAELPSAEIPDAWQRGAGAASTPEETHASPCAEEGHTPRPDKEVGTASPGVLLRDSGQHSGEKQEAQRDMGIGRDLWLPVEKNPYKRMLEKQLAGESSGSEGRRRGNICHLHVVERRRSRSMPSATVARRAIACRRCKARRVKRDGAVASLCTACKAEMTLLLAKEYARKPPAGLTERGGLRRRRSTSCADAHMEGNGSSRVENSPLGSLLPVLLLLKDASLGVRYAHIYTHSNLWNGDGSRCMRPELHKLPHIVSAQVPKIPH